MAAHPLRISCQSACKHGLRGEALGLRRRRTQKACQVLSTIDLVLLIVSLSHFLFPHLRRSSQRTQSRPYCFSSRVLPVALLLYSILLASYHARLSCHCGTALQTQYGASRLQAGGLAPFNGRAEQFNAVIEFANKTAETLAF